MQDRETKDLLIESAKKEFSAKGYCKASLRTICANASLTTGALYFFFKDKEDLFASIVEKPLADMISILHTHFQEYKIFSNLSFRSDEADEIGVSHGNLAEQLIHCLYENYDAFILLLTKSQGTRFENTVDRIINMTERNYFSIAEIMVKHYDGMKVNSHINHWIAHITVDAFIQILTHERNEKRAIAQMTRILNFIVNGLTALALIPENEI